MRDGECQQSPDKGHKIGLLVLINQEAWRRRGTQFLAAEFRHKATACLKGKCSYSLDLEKVFGRTLKSSTRVSAHSLGKRLTHCSLIKFIDDLKGLQEKSLVAYSLNFKQA